MRPGELGSESRIGFALLLGLGAQVVGLSCEVVDFDEKLRLPQCSFFGCRSKKGSDATASTETNEKGGGDLPIGQTHPLPQFKAGSYEMAAAMTSASGHAIGLIIGVGLDASPNCPLFAEAGGCRLARSVLRWVPA